MQLPSHPHCTTSPLTLQVCYTYTSILSLPHAAWSCSTWETSSPSLSRGKATEQHISREIKSCETERATDCVNLEGTHWEIEREKEQTGWGRTTAEIFERLPRFEVMLQPWILSYFCFQFVSSILHGSFPFNMTFSTLMGGHTPKTNTVL